MRAGVRLTRVAPLASLAVVAAIAGALSFGASAAVADDSDGTGIGLEVTVTDAPGPNPSATSSGGRRSGATPDAAVATTPAPSATPRENEVDVGGILFFGGLSSGYGWSVNPFAGEAVTSFTVRNVSDTVIDSTVRFSAQGPFGNRLSEVKVPIEGLKPHESREVSATLTGLGQWTFIETRATLTPPKTVEGTALEPISRVQNIIVPPWLLLGGSALAFGAAAVVRGIRGPRAVLEPIAAVVGATA